MTFPSLFFCPSKKEKREKKVSSSRIRFLALVAPSKKQQSSAIALL